MHLLQVLLVLAFAGAVQCIRPTEVDELFAKCLNTFSVKTVHGETVDITAAKIIRQGDCRKVAKKERNLVEDINASIFLDVTTSMPGNGKYLSNISWTYTALQEHRIPRKFILYFNFFHVNDIDYDKVCLVLKTKQSLLQKHDQVTFHLTCLPLLREPDLEILVQVWCVSGKRFTRPCRRGKRDVARNSCGVLCSNDRVFPMSIDNHKGQICKCYIRNYNQPVLNWWHNNSSGVFYIRLRNLPPFLENTEVIISDGNIHSNCCEILNKQNSGIIPGDTEQSLQSQRSYNYSGNYSVSLDAVCPLDNNQHDHSDDCRNNRLLLHYGDQFILVEENALQPAVDTSLNHSIIIAIVSATAFGSIVITTIVFVVRRCRTKKSSRSRPTIRTPVAVNSDSEMYNQQSSTGTEMQTFLSNNMTTKNDDLCSHSKKLHSNADLDIYRREEIKPLQYDPDIVSENHDYSKHEYDPEEHIKDDMRCRCNVYS
ncbi:uncharacterized protein LOC128217865 [Mya arenaria]|uniref:uncharacterized protein LOC128217865 n=1 Tax=Mya arenaria TaxID=6604 RepID=UPI0022E19007|nr:uncharacterized protein LOC128217865 [Mya arenaria]XP_052781252.1 uncharacterized protein LOC128217865 [Mya arenaria]XP_052781253.1 uncharacterized protein LOC128217865 [Mya arenaria]XP_052781254.1 uncharacterized protein LOC128217865 [Mya arenaria]XP_052781255.1 uncharacterized protein LOC128217865 [Mya arenaria]XP_052781256.1 uncharacterized protein LOC128217865 [Mya arenaria]